MAHFLFVDESGQDLQESPCEVLAGAAVRDSSLWPFVREVHQTELDCFGSRYSAGARELKARKLLKAKVFKHASVERAISGRERRELARKILESGAGAGPRELAAFAQAKMEFTRRLLGLCAKFKIALFACIVPKGAPKPDRRDFLRKDYAYLFERFFYFLEDRRASRGQGIIVFDELEKSRSHILIQQMDSYFKKTRKGRERSALVVPEPFFVHSDLTTGIQIADLMAYLLVWGFLGLPGKSPARPELKEFADSAVGLAYKTSRPQGSRRIGVQGITIIPDLRASTER